MDAEITLSSVMIAVDSLIAERVKKIAAIARQNLLEQGTHLPTAVLHALDGMFPIVLPFKNEEQRKALIDYVKEQAIQRHAFAVTTVSCAKVVDSRSGREEETLVLATAIQGGSPYVAVQAFTRGDDDVVTGFGELVEGDEAAGPGQMTIFPDWEGETRH
jgi:hypothetical protein